MDVQANPVLGAISEDRGIPEALQQPVSPDQLPLRFPDGNWPWYAQGEIFLNPEPPIPGVPAEICAGVVNDDLNAAHVALLQFGVAPLGIGVLYLPIETVEVVVPPGGYAAGCVMWMSPEFGRWGIEVLLFQEGSQEPLRSLRNIDPWEPLIPGEPHDLVFQIGPLGAEGIVSFEPINYLPGWEVAVLPGEIPVYDPNAIYTATLRTVPPAGMMLGTGLPIADVEGYLNDQMIGGFRKMDNPAVPLHVPVDPSYAESEITVDPYPINAGEPTQVCVKLRNPTAFPQDVVVHFSWANFGIGLPFTPINGPFPVNLPPYSQVMQCIQWVPPIAGHVCVQVILESQGYEPQFSQRNLDVNEPLQPGIPDMLTIPVGNPLAEPVTITLGLIPLLPDWGFELSQDVLPAMQPGEVREVILTVHPPSDLPLPPDNTPVVDVEAYANGMLIGGIRKVFRPPVPIHIPGDPIYAEREIFVTPYPPRAGEPTEICVQLRNPTDQEQVVDVIFSRANFGIGLPFTPIGGAVPVTLPANSVVTQCIYWVPPFGGHFCVQVEVILPGYEQPFFSQLNLDVDEPLEPLVPHSRTFPVGNPLPEPVTITLGMIPHLPDWQLELSQDVLPAMQPGEVREVTLTVTPPEAMPADGDPIVDVEAYANGELIGGFRKIFRPPVPIHIPRDPIYAESEIGVDPYPVIPGVPTQLSVEVFNPTDQDRIVTAIFSIASFGIGLPFDPSNIAPNPVQIYVPANGAARGFVTWTPPEWEGKFCVKVTLEMEGQDPVWSQRNIDVGEPLQPGVPHDLIFEVGSGEFTQPVTITLGMILHKEGWEVSLSQDVLPAVQPGELRQVTLTVTPPADAPLGTGEPIVDVEAFVAGELLGGFRKLDVPPIPIHKPHEKGYSESEIFVNPYPPVKDEISIVGAVVQNTSDVAATVDLEFGWADFGMGIPFTTTGMVPPTGTITLSPGTTTTVTVDWTPEQSGHQCIIVHLTDPAGIYEPQESQRNVDVVENPPCGFTKIYPFTIYNVTQLTVTVDLGLITFNVPPDWIISTVPSGSVEIGPYGSLVVEVFVTIPCPKSPQDWLDYNAIAALLAESGGVPTIDVEGYVDGVLLGGIELRFGTEFTYTTLLPFTVK
jgi:hypothetical protein